jgi:hypothetical protein
LTTALLRLAGCRGTRYDEAKPLAGRLAIDDVTEMLQGGM